MCPQGERLIVDSLHGSTMRRHRVPCYLLLFLLLSAQPDEVWAVNVSSSAIPIVNHGEYLPPEVKHCQEQPGLCHKPVFVSPVGRPQDDFFRSCAVLSVTGYAGPFGPSSLYVFLSLRR